MMHDEEEFIARALGHLPREMAPPPGLEDATVRTLRSAGVLRPPMRLGLSVASWLLAAGVAGIAFVGGSVFATRMSVPATRAAQAVRGVSDAQPAPGAGPTFALLLYGASSGDDSATHAARAGEYARWAQDQHTAGRIIGGEALGTAVASVALATARRQGMDSIIVNEEPDNAADFVGYFVIQAPNRDSALSLARNCPHLKYGGRIVVRRIWPSRQALPVVPVRDSGAP